MRAVLFDVYETLLSGERVKDRESALQRVAKRFGLEVPQNLSIASALDTQIEAAHQRSPVSHPEVDIREIWSRIFPTLTDPEGFALAAEEAIHPVTAVPGAAGILEQLHRAGLVLGIVSNAQHYTRHLLERHLGEAWKLIDPELRFFSYEHGIAKPASHLFELALTRLARRGIAPDETLMIGDSMENDIKPAKALGCATYKIVPGKLEFPDGLS